MNSGFLHLSEPLDYPAGLYVSHGVRISEVLLYYIPTSSVSSGTSVSGIYVQVEPILKLKKMWYFYRTTISGS